MQETISPYPRKKINPPLMLAHLPMKPDVCSGAPSLDMSVPQRKQRCVRVAPWQRQVDRRRARQTHLPTDQIEATTKTDSAAELCPGGKPIAADRRPAGLIVLACVSSRVAEMKPISISRFPIADTALARSSRWQQTMWRVLKERGEHTRYNIHFFLNLYGESHGGRK